MNNPAALGKVTAFVTRGTADARELLVFRHPHAGVQIPAGTVEEGEAAEAAALRETWEETGLPDVAGVAYLGGRPQPMRPGELAVLRRVTLRDGPGVDAPEIPPPTWFLGLRRGLYVRQVGQASDGWARVAFEEFDGPAHLATAPTRSVTGWVPEDAVTASVIRHFFHLTPTAPTPDAWVQHAEEWEHRFELFWAPLTADAVVEDLLPPQAAWLAEFAPDLLRGKVM